MRPNTDTSRSFYGLKNFQSSGLPYLHQLMLNETFERILEFWLNREMFRLQPHTVLLEAHDDIQFYPTALAEDENMIIKDKYHLLRRPHQAKICRRS